MAAARLGVVLHLDASLTSISFLISSFQINIQPNRTKKAQFFLNDITICLDIELILYFSALDLEGIEFNTIVEHFHAQKACARIFENQSEVF